MSIDIIPPEWASDATANAMDEDMALMSTDKREPRRTQWRSTTY